VNIWDITPSYLTYFLAELDEQHTATDIKYTLVGGENLSNQDIEQYHRTFKGNSRLINVYGVTEATVDSTSIFLDENTCYHSTIGRPITNNRIYILDANRHLVPIGVPGEICIAGAGLGRGYLNDRVLTAAKFIDNPYEEGQKLYCTGDMGRWTDDGIVEFIGRMDTQVKIRGHRIELTEIEKLLRKREDIKSAITLVKKDSTGTKQLVTYYTSREPVDESVLRHYISQHLPYYMIPSFLVAMNSFPLTVNGKLDTKAMPDPMSLPPAREKAGEDPESEMEISLKQIWKKVLGSNGFSTEDNFFNIGGNSLKVIQLYKNLQETYPGIIEVHDLFSHPSIKSQAQLIQNRVHDESLEQNKIVTIDF
jgi:acyl-coenzyme A synthetase/AMP-(fatty) acid ligase